MVSLSVGLTHGKSVQTAATGEQPGRAVAAAGRDGTAPVKVSTTNTVGSIKLSVGTYNCEGFLTAAHYIADCLLPACDVLFLSETWLPRAQEAYLTHTIASLSPGEYHCVQDFGMELPPRAGEGRPRGGVALVCRRQTGRAFRTVDCGDPRLCGIKILESARPLVTG